MRRSADRRQTGAVPCFAGRPRMPSFLLARAPNLVERLLQPVVCVVGIIDVDPLTRGRRISQPERTLTLHIKVRPQPERTLTLDVHVRVAQPERTLTLDVHVRVAQPERTLTLDIHVGPQPERPLTLDIHVRPQPERPLTLVV